MKDSNGQKILAGDRIVWCGTKGSMCDVDVVDRGGILWGIGPFTEYPLENWLLSSDFDYCEIVGRTEDILKEDIIEMPDDIFATETERSQDDDLPF